MQANCEFAANETKAEPSWKDMLAGERRKPYFEELMRFVENERASGKIIYPKNSEVFAALNSTPFHQVRVVIVGQDPYPGPNQAHGLCFSVRKGVPLPGSLQNIFKELNRSLGIRMPDHGCLESWASQGVLLLNTVLTVEAGKPQSHANRGWELLTDKIIESLNNGRKGLIFMLWGSHAQRKCEAIDTGRHHVLRAPHPSPLSAHRGFLGCGHFKAANELLARAGQAQIDWAI